MSQLKALIFDCDGTLAETEEAHRAAFNQMFKDVGLPWNWGVPMYRELLDVTGGRERIRHYVTKFHPDLMQKILKGNNVAKMHERKTAIYGEMAKSGSIKFRPGVERLFEEARKEGLLLGIATTTNLAPLTALFEGTLGKEALSTFDAVVTGDMVEVKKPAPDLFLLALEKLQLPPENCLAIEDSRNGIVSATKAGLATLITKSAYTDHQEFPDALAVTSNLGEPHKPFTPLGGEASEPGVVDVATLKRWHAKAATLAGAEINP